ncbi:MAG: hypothetical protein JXB30_04040 [Anaerolineae bacterium]|nr:hypothetical protein [Anaerolineae bacterium]
MKTILPRLGLWLFFLWLMTFVFSYYLLHSPSVVVVVSAVRLILIDILALSILLAIAGAFGNLMFGISDKFSQPEQVALQVLLGLGIISLIVLAVGMVGLFPPRWLAWIISLGCLAALHRPLLAWLLMLRGALKQLLGQGAKAPKGLFSGWVRISVLLMLVPAGLMTLAPPTEWDSLTYHLAGPQVFINAGRIISFPEIHYLGFPFLTEMLYSWLMIMARPQTGPMLHACLGLIMLMLLLGWGERMSKSAVGWLTAAILLAGSLLWEEFHWAYSDLSAMAYILAALINVLAYYDSFGQSCHKALVWAGVFAGMALGTKYTVIGPVAGLGILVLWLARHEGVHGLLRAGGVLSLVILVLVSPWLIKNVILYGNPFAPFIWGTEAFDQFDQYSYLHPGTGYTDPVSLLIVPLRGTIFGQIREGPDNLGGPLLFSLLPLAAIGWQRRAVSERQFIINILVFALPPYLFWLYGISISFYLTHTRLLFPIFPPIALVSAIGLESLGKAISAPDIEKCIRVVVSAGLAAAVFFAGISCISENTLKVSFGLMSEGDYLTEALPGYYEAMQHINNELPKDARILFLWEPRIFYCRRYCIPDSLLNQWWHDRQLEPEPRKVAQGWREQGITHVLVWDAGMESLVSDELGNELIEPQDVTALEIVRREDLELIWDLRLPVEAADDFLVYSLYELKGIQP